MAERAGPPPLEVRRPVLAASRNAPGRSLAEWGTQRGVTSPTSRHENRTDVLICQGGAQRNLP